MGGAGSVSLIQAAEKLVIAPLGGAVFHADLGEWACSATSELQERGLLVGLEKWAAPRNRAALSWAGRDQAVKGGWAPCCLRRCSTLGCFMVL